METLTKVTVPTVTLRDVVTRASKGSTNIDVIPLSSLMQIKIENGKIYVNTTDNINYLTTYSEVTADNLEIVVSSKSFVQIVSKITSVDTTIIVEGKKVTIEANGTYNLNNTLDADGTTLKFPSVEVSPVGSTYHLKPEEVKSILSLSKSCKGEKNELPAVIGNYYVGPEGVLTTNYYKACCNPIKISDTSLLLSSSVADLISSVVDDNGVDVYQDNDYIVFESTVGKLIGKKQNDVNNFPAKELYNLVSNSLASAVVMNRTMFIQAVDRMCLFVDEFEQNRLYLTFTKDGLNLYSAKTNSSEVVNYISTLTEITEDIKFSINGCFLKSELAACDKEELTIRFSPSVGLQIVCGEATLMLGILNSAE